MRPDPPVRKDGDCSVCGKPRRPERSRKYGKAAAELDPFCSSSCARRYHGQELAKAAGPPPELLDALHGALA